MELIDNCVFCGNKVSLTLDDRKWAKYCSGTLVGEAFPDLDNFSRDFIVTRVCFDCQERMYNTPTEEHKEAWGPVIGYCPCCDTNIYKNKNKVKDEDNKYVCPTCYTKYSLLEDGSLEEEETL